MSSVARHLATGISVESGVVVSKVERQGNRWTLLNSDDESLGTFNVVVVALPPEQAIRLLEASSSLAGKASDVEMHPCWASLVVFEEPLSLAADGIFLDLSLIHI